MSRQCFTTVSTAMALAISPWASPPMPSESTKRVQRLNDLVAIFVVGTYATHVGHAATCDSHTNSPCRVKQHPYPHVYRATLFPR